MAKYRVLVTSFINNSLHEAGSIVEYDGDVSENVELIEDEKPKGKKAPAEESLV
jgi:hypothetical protein